MNKWRVAVCLVFLSLLTACGEASPSTSEDLEPSESTSPSTVEDTDSVNTSTTVREPEMEDTVVSSPSTTEPAAGVVVEVLCDGDSSCAAEYFLNGQIYSHGCEAVDPEAVLLGEVLGSGTAFFQDINVFAVVDYPNHDVVAVNIEGGICSDDDTDEFVSPWSFAWTAGADINEASCEVGLMSDERRRVNGC